MRFAAALAVFALAASTAVAQVDQRRIDQAIKRGCDWLKTAPSPGHEHSKAEHSDELILYTFITAGVPESDKRFKALFERSMSDELHQTYKVALLAMSLEELDRVKHQNRIAQCAQFLVDNQTSSGLWSYGKPTTYPAWPPVPADVASGGSSKKGLLDFGATKEKPKVVRRLPVKKQRDGDGGGDNSNAQYAALGLRACYDAGIIFEESVITLAAKWWMESQHQPEDGAAGNAVVSGGGERPRGWSYRMPGGNEGAKAYGSMTAGGVGAVVIYDYMLKKDWKKNPVAKSGMAWLASNYSVTQNVNKGAWYYYYLYGLERAGILYDTNMIGNKDWYLDGAKVLLEKQDGNGSWEGKTWETCFAILFLKKATKPLVASEGGKR